MNQKISVDTRHSEQIRSNPSVESANNERTDLLVVTFEHAHDLQSTGSWTPFSLPLLLRVLNDAARSLRVYLRTLKERKCRRNRINPGVVATAAETLLPRISIILVNYQFSVFFLPQSCDSLIIAQHFVCKPQYSFQWILLTFYLDRFTLLC